MQRIKTNLLCLHQEIGTAEVKVGRKKVKIRVILSMGGSIRILIDDGIEREGGFTGMQFEETLKEMIERALELYQHKELVLEKKKVINTLLTT